MIFLRGHEGADRGAGWGLAVVRDVREARVPAGPEELAAFETDVLAGFVLARAAAGLSDRTISLDVSHLEQVRAWFGRPLWEMVPADADEYFGKVLRASAKGTRLSRAQALKTYFVFLEVRHKAAVYQLTGYVAECPVDEMNRPRGGQGASLRIPPDAGQVERLFAGWRQELGACRKFAPAARNYAAARLMAEVGLRVNEARCLDLADVRWELGRFGKLHVRHGKGARGSGPRERMVPLINGAGRTLRWFVEDVRGLFGDDFARHGAPLLPSERHNADGTAARAGAEALRAGLAAAAAHLPEWEAALTPHVLRHFCASQLYLGGMDLLAIQQALGHSWVATTMAYVHVHATHVEDAWIAGQERARCGWAGWPCRRPVRRRDAVTGLDGRSARLPAGPCCMPAGTGTGPDARGVSPATPALALALVDMVAAAAARRARRRGEGRA